jgi:D-alanine-D-alanine ligase
MPGGWLVEEYVEGRELTVGLTQAGDGSISVFPPVEVVLVPSGGRAIYSKEVKDGEFRILDGKGGVWAVTDLCRIECPAALPATVAENLARAATAAFRALTLRDFARLDFRLRPSGEAVFLEANPLPGLVPNWSDFGIAALGAGLKYDELIERMLRPACERASRRREAAASK